MEYMSWSIIIFFFI